jgi:hypothetical protein
MGVSLIHATRIKSQRAEYPPERPIEFESNCIHASTLRKIIGRFSSILQNPFALVRQRRPPDRIPTPAKGPPDCIGAALPVR